MFPLKTILTSRRTRIALRLHVVLASITMLLTTQTISAQMTLIASTLNSPRSTNNGSNGKTSIVEVSGYVKDVQQMTPWEGATVFLYNKLNKTIYITKTNQNGQYIFHITPPCSGVIKAMDRNAFNDCMSFEINSSKPDSIETVDRDLLLEKVPLGKDWHFRNIYYDSGKWDLRPDAYPILDSIVHIMRLYPVKIKVNSYTDALGSEKLAQLRAETVAKYFIKKGIESDRIVAKGYGSRLLLYGPNYGTPASETENQENRRTEFKIIDFTSFEKTIEPFDPSQWHDGEVVNVPSTLAEQINLTPCASFASFENNTKLEAPQPNQPSVLSFNKDSITIQPFQGAVIQIGAFKNKNYAMALYQKAVSQSGKHTIILIEDQFYKVRLSGFSSENQARLFVQQLNKLGFKATYLPILPRDFSIKIGSFNNELNARSAQKDIKQQTNHPVTIEIDPPHFYVKINNFKTKEAAQSAISTLK